MLVITNITVHLQWSGLLLQILTVGVTNQYRLAYNYDAVMLRTLHNNWSPVFQAYLRAHRFDP